MSGWQEAVAGLQAQIDTIDTQVSSISGQEASQAAILSSLQTQVASLQTEVLAQNEVIADIPASEIAPVSSINGLITFPLVSGGFAVIQFPSSIDNSPFTIIVAAHVHTPNLSSGTISLNLGTPSGAVNDGIDVAQISIGGAVDNSGFTRVQGFWSSTTQKLFISQDTNPAKVIPVSDISQLTFFLSGGTNQNATNDSVTITKFRATAD